MSSLVAAKHGGYWGLGLALAAAGTLVGLRVGTFLGLPTEQRMNVFPDDSFYYMTPALNLAKGLGPTGDGSTLTSGFHPLWMGMETVLAIACGGDRELFFRGVVLAGALLHVATAGVLYLLGARLVSPLLAVVWSVFYVVGHRGLMDAIGGTEAPLLAFLLAAFLYVEARQPPCSPVAGGFRKRSILRGLLLGLLFLARTDASILVVAWLVIHAVLGLRHSQTVEVLRSTAVTASAAAITVLPWLLLSLHWYGTIFQQSLMMKEFWRSRLLEGASVGEVALFDARMFHQSIHGLKVYPLVWYLMAFLAGATSIKLGLPKKTTASEAQACDAARNVAITCGALLVYILGAGLFYATHFHFVREWYYAPARVFWPAAGILLCSIVAAPGTNSRQALLARVVIALAVLASIVFSVQASVREGALRSTGATRGTGQFVTMAEWISRNTPRSTVVAAYSSGILSYYVERPVINLDGLCNTDILGVMRRQTMAEYLEQQGVTHLADHESIVWPDLVVGLRRDARPGFVEQRLEEIHRVPCDSQYGDIVCWRVLPSQAKSARTPDGRQNGGERGPNGSR